MKIDFVVQGTTDRAFLKGLKDRLCPSAELFKGNFRGTKLRPHDYPKICEEARLQGAEIVVILTDGDKRKWKDIRKEELKRVKDVTLPRALIGVADRNIERWICADSDYIAERCGIDPNSLRVDDPKSAFEKALGINREDKKEEEIADLVRQAPLKVWLNNSPSFKRFYKDVQSLANELGCRIPDEMGRSRTRP